MIFFNRMELGEEPLVETGAALFRELCYNYRDSLMAGILVAGWDKHRGGQIYSIPIGGMCVRQPVSIGGSGSSYVYGYVDANYKRGMSKEECVKFVTHSKCALETIEFVLLFIILTALALAMSRDGSSGGVVRLGVITEDGIDRRVVLGDQLPTFFEEL